MCYYLETIEYDDPLFKEVDATYIIHLEKDISRYEDIKQQLSLYHPTKIVHILFNKGFKTCDKPQVNNTVEDLMDACSYIMEDAKKYNTILLLEDDFMFDSQVKEHTQNIDSFVSTHHHFIYRLGCIPQLILPYNGYTYVGLSGGTHAVLLSQSVRNKISFSKNRDWDIYLNFLSINYIYYTPLCYQLFPETENQKNWGYGNSVLLINIYLGLLHLLKLHKQIHPGYSIMYAYAKIIPFILLYILYRILKKYTLFNK